VSDETTNETILVDIHERVGTFTLNRPKVLAEGKGAAGLWSATRSASA
jgi:hypothetical protein